MPLPPLVDTVTVDVEAVEVAVLAKRIDLRRSGCLADPGDEPSPSATPSTTDELLWLSWRALRLRLRVIILSGGRVLLIDLSIQFANEF